MFLSVVNASRTHDNSKETLSSKHHVNKPVKGPEPLHCVIQKRVSLSLYIEPEGFGAEFQNIKNIDLSTLTKTNSMSYV